MVDDSFLFFCSTNKLYLKGDTSENLIGLLERRLDAVIYRAKFATTVFSARQLINHGHIRVNGKKVNIGSYIVKEEDSIEIRDKSKQLAIIDIALASKERETANYLNSIYLAFELKLLNKTSNVLKNDTYKRIISIIFIIFNVTDTCGR